MTRRAAVLAVVLAVVVAVGCGGDSAPDLVVVTFNSGTTAGLGHDSGPDDGYTQTEADISDQHYGDGLAWRPFVDATAAFFAELDPDVVVFQEIFDPGDCASIPAELHAGFYCEGYADGDPTVAQAVLGAGYQVACNLGKPDKCAAVKREVGAFRGCASDLCLDGLDGAEVDGCGSGSRVGRGVIDLVGGGELTVVNVHGSSGLAPGDELCRSAQFEQVFVDLDGTGGAPAASGAVNLIMGDLNTDPVRFANIDDSAARFAELVDTGGFAFVTDVGDDAEPTYSGLVNIDHVVSDRLEGSCEARPFLEATYFDHVPIVCGVSGL